MCSMPSRGNAPVPGMDGRLRFDHANFGVEDIDEIMIGANCATVDAAFRAFTERRFSRCRHVVESSVRLGELELAGAPGEEQGRVYAEAVARLAEPA